MNDELKIAKMYLTEERNRELSDIFNQFATLETPDSEARVVEELARLQKQYPTFVYMPFIRVYNAMVEAKKYAMQH